MAIGFQCPQCRKSYSVKDEYAGKKAKCSCGAVLDVPTQNGADAPAVSEVVVPVRSGLAGGAFALALLSIIAGCIGPIAIVLGIVALVKIERGGGRFTGRRLAIASIVVPVVAGALQIWLALFITRGRATRAVCLSNLRQLTIAWVLYADDNDDRLVNGVAGQDRVQDGVVSERAWAARDWADGYQDGDVLSKQEQHAAIKAGALWPYCETVDVYHCPASSKGAVRTYSIVDSVNGLPREGTYSGNEGLRVGRTILWVKKRYQILRAPYRNVFIDVGFAKPDSYAVHYDKPQWWDPPPLRHHSKQRRWDLPQMNLSTLSFADGHSEIQRWKSPETIRHARAARRKPGSDMFLHFSPETPEAVADLQKIQKGCWGQIGYE